MHRSICSAALLSLLVFANTASAQEALPRFKDLARTMGREPGALGPNESVVTSTLVLSFPFSGDTKPEQQNENALRAFYQLAAKSCSVVLETIADSCVLAGVSSSVNLRSREGERGVTVNGQINMRVTFKDAQPNKL